MTDKYAVIGNPISHSKSPQIHRMFAEQTGQNISYEAILAPLDGFVATIERLRGEGYKGCNVTVPFKFEAFQLATQLSRRAEMAQAVNTLKFDGHSILGDNTDGAGLIRDIENNFQFKLQDKQILLMGTGGAAYGAAAALLEVNARLVTIGYRTEGKAQMLATRFNQHKEQIHIVGYSNIEDQFDIVINATSSGLADEMPPLPRKNQIPLNSPFVQAGAGGIFAPGALAYDMMYGRETPFLKFAREQGAAIVADGLGMLVEQAAEAFYIWRGVRPDTTPVICAIRAAK